MGKVLSVIAALVFGGWILNSLMGLGSLWNSNEYFVDELEAEELIQAEISQPKSKTLPFLLGGVQMNEGDQVKWIKSLHHSGMNTVEVTVYAHQGRWFDNNLWFGDVSNGTVEEIRAAKKAGMKVVLILRLQMDHSFPENKFLWHGMVYPETSYLLNKWFETYTRFAKMWAQIAQREGVDVFVMGSEMNALFSSRFIKKVPVLESYFLSKKQQENYREKVVRLGEDRLTSKYLSVYGEPNYTDVYSYLTDRSECNRKWVEKVACTDSVDMVLGMNRRRATQNFYWEKLIQDLRQVYNGKLTVAANFDNFEQIKFWNKLDYVGINAYFPLRELGNDDKPLEIQFREGWDQVLGKIMNFRDSMGINHMPVLFTELGYTNYSGGTLAPWQGNGFSLLETPGKDSLIIWDQQAIDNGERNAAVKALAWAVKRSGFPLAGALYWKFTSWEHQVKEDPFALLIGPESKDSLQYFLGDLKNEN